MALSPVFEQNMYESLQGAGFCCQVGRDSWIFFAGKQNHLWDWQEKQSFPLKENYLARFQSLQDTSPEYLNPSFVA